MGMNSYNQSYLAPKQICEMQPEQEEPLIGSGRHRNVVDSDEDDDMINHITKQKQTQNQPQYVVPTPRKKAPVETDTTPEKLMESMDIETKVIPTVRFQDLPEEVVFYMSDVYSFSGKLFITGVLPSGQTLNLVANNPIKELYFCLKSEYSDMAITEQRMAQARRQIDQRLSHCGFVKDKTYSADFVEKQYVFEIDGVPREKRPYYQVRYPFKIDPKQIKEEPKPDWQGETYRYVFGTTYSPLQLFIVNTGIKGPGWAKVQKMHLTENKVNVQSGLCADVIDAELIEPTNDIPRPPNMRVMSVSIKTIAPNQVIKNRNIFKNVLEKDMSSLHIYAISYFLCDDYQIELKPSKYHGIHRTLFLREFGGQSPDKTMVPFETEKQMIAQFQADLRRYDPDVLVCHDASRTLDALVQRMVTLGGKQDRPKLGRLVHYYQNNKNNQQQRINSAIAGRLLVDTFTHARDMIKSVDYELEAMAAHIKPAKAFKDMPQDEVIQNLIANRTMMVIRKAREEAEVTFALMNHLQILQITRQLSNICGNTWKRSLEIQRAERNEYLIMHECISRGLIIPDKFRKEKGGQEEEEVDRKKYQGGHVLDPMKGFYKDFILLLDFNSLYPSIIREYNVCFSVIKRPLVPLSAFYRNRDKNAKKDAKQVKDRTEVKEEPMQIEEMQVHPPPKEECKRDKWGFLPTLIEKIVDRRKKCKKAMKNAPPEKCIILDIQQKCYKLVANSIYGCLGFSISRFYSKHLAALITRMGREALLRAKDIVGGMGGVRVIYGDTDSLMIQPHGLQKQNDREKLFEIKNIAQQLKKNINKEYDNLEIDVDGIFKPLILLMKKKYVANKLTNYDRIIAGLDHHLTFNTEYKGIQVVRRDSFELARNFLRKILEILMNSTKSEPQETYEQIYAYAREIREQFPGINFKNFLFSKQLNKPPKEYARGETIPHVKVALDRIKAGEKEQTLVNHIVQYIVCRPKDKSQDSLAKCCFDDKAFERSIRFPGDSGPLQIDDEYYKQELVQPVWRITQHLEDFSTDKFLEELGLSEGSRKKFKKQMETEREQGQTVLEGSISHNNTEKSKRFSELMGEITCFCGQGMSAAEGGKLTTVCSHCNKGMLATISNRLMFVLKERVAEYYINKFQCKCNKQYNLNPFSECCKIKFKPKSNIPFEISETVYVAKDLLRVNLREIANKSGETPQARRLKALQDKLDQFLQQSDFQRVGNINALFKV